MTKLLALSSSKRSADININWTLRKLIKNGAWESGEGIDNVYKFFTFANLSPFSSVMTVFPSSIYDWRKSILLPQSMMGIGFDVLSCKEKQEQFKHKATLRVKTTCHAYKCRDSRLINTDLGERSTEMETLLSEETNRSFNPFSFNRLDFLEYKVRNSNRLPRWLPPSHGHQ